MKQVFQFSPLLFAASLQTIKAICTLKGDYDETATRDAVATCSTISFGDLEVGPGQTLDLSDLRPNTQVQFSGKIVFDVAQKDQYLVRITGKSVKIVGLKGHVFDGKGQILWDNGGAYKGKVKPKFFSISVEDSIVQNLNVINSPAHTFIIASHDSKFSGIQIDNSAGDGIARNTDGLHVTESSNLHFEHCTIITQDDCFTITSGENIYFGHIDCICGHGASVGSVGKKNNNIVQNVIYDSITLRGSTNGFRIKALAGATGTVQNVTASNFILQEVTEFGIIIQENYDGTGTSGQANSDVEISQIQLLGFSGSLTNSAQPYYIACDNCKDDWTVKGVDLDGGSFDLKCQNVPISFLFKC